MWEQTTPDDPLGVLTTTWPVVERADFVRIDSAAVAETARKIAARELVPPEWDDRLHWRDGREEMANYLLVLDALNFSFWGEPRWVVSVEGLRYNGYWALAAALTRALRRGVPLYDAAYLEQIDRRQLGEILAGEHPVPMLDDRVTNLQEVGRVLRTSYGGQFASAIEDAGGSAARLVRVVVEHFASFRDVTTFDGQEVRFYKRAQILAGDLYGAFGGRDLGAFDDLGSLTAFADYKVPQVLHALGVLDYVPSLVRTLWAKAAIPPGTREEVEIRAGTIWAVEELRRELVNLGRPLPAFQIDWALWQLGQDLPATVVPYHRTRTIFY